MHTMKLRISDSVFDKIEYFLNNLPKEDVEIISNDIINNNSKGTIDFSKYNIDSFQSIINPVEWQRSIRDEWERQLKYLLDTNPIINAINRALVLPRADYLISIISEIELLSFSKLSIQEEYIINSLLDNFKIINLNSDIKNKTIEIRKKYNLKLPDSVIAATAIVEDAILVTEDKQLLKINEIEVVSIKEVII